MLLSVAGYAQKRVSVEDFGLKPDTRVNAVPYVQKAIEECRKTEGAVLFFPKGRYDFWPQYAEEKNYYESNTYDVLPKRLAILFEGINGVTLDGDGSMFVMHDRIQPVTLDKSSGVVLKNFSVDWDIPLTAEADVISSSQEYFDIKIDVLESPYVIENGRLMFVGEGWKSEVSGFMEFELETGYVAPYTGDIQALGGDWSDYEAKNIEYGVVRIGRKGGFKRMPIKGNRLVLRHSSRDHAGIFICNSKNIQLTDVNVYHTAGLGILSQYSENISFLRVDVAPNKAKNRVLSGHDDGFHFMGCKGQISVDSCYWAGLMDDPINVHGTCVRIIEVKPGNTLVCRFMHDMSEGMVWGEVGDKVGLIDNKSMSTVAENTIKSIKTIDLKLFEVVLTNPIDKSIIVGSAMENLTWVPDVDIRNSHFGPCRARGLLISTPGKVVVENNIFESSGAAILIAGDANQWYESGAVKDVLIKGNEFRYICMSSMYQFCQAVITVEPEIPELDPQRPFHRNIRIENNSFDTFDAPIVYAKSVNGLTFTSNKITRSYKLKPFHARKDAFTLEGCKNVTIDNNEVSEDVVSHSIVIDKMDKKELNIGKKELFKLKK